MTNLGSVLVFLSLLAAAKSEIEIDDNGYLMFCPCMGRFGNQLDQFLGALSFAKDLNRTLILPNWIEYPEGRPGSEQIPFENYFQVEPLKEYTKVVLIEHFMKNIAPTVWPKGKRIVFCYGPRGDSTCSAKEGNPFGPYWDKFGIDFDRDEFFGPLGYDLTFEEHKKAWGVKYSPKVFPVLAFTGAPGAFPVLPKDLHLQKYVKWSKAIESEADAFLQKLNLGESDKIIGLHLRNGIDFKRACEHVKNNAKQNFFASAQCLGYHLENGEMSYELCFPPQKLVIKQLGKLLKKSGATHVFVASDDNHMVDAFQKKFKNVTFVRLGYKNPKIDLSILGKCDFAIVNCVSSFSAFVKRQRDVEAKFTEFWAFEPKRHTEL